MERLGLLAQTEGEMKMSGDTAHENYPAESSSRKFGLAIETQPVILNPDNRKAGRNSVPMLYC
jgi:hypothetical protein